MSYKHNADITELRQQGFKQSERLSFADIISASNPGLILDKPPVGLSQKSVNDSASESSDDKDSLSVIPIIAYCASDARSTGRRDRAQSRLLDPTSIKLFIQSCDRITWTSHQNIQERYNTWNTDRANFNQSKNSFIETLATNPTTIGNGANPQNIFDNPQEMRQLLNGQEKLLAKYDRLLSEQTRLVTEEKFLNQVIQERMSAIQSAVNQYTDAAGLSRIAIELDRSCLPDSEHNPHSREEYLPPHYVLTSGNKPRMEPIEERIASILGRHEQMDLITRWVLDETESDTKIKPEDRFEAAKKLFRERTGHTMPDTYLTHVIEARKGQNLKADESRTASVLAESYKELTEIQEKERKHNQRTRQLIELAEALRTNKPITSILGDLKNKERMRILFGQDEAPKEVREIYSVVQGAYRAGDTERGDNLANKALRPILESEIESRKEDLRHEDNDIESTRHEAEDKIRRTGVNTEFDRISGEIHSIRHHQEMFSDANSSSSRPSTAASTNAPAPKEQPPETEDRLRPTEERSSTPGTDTPPRSQRAPNDSPLEWFFPDRFPNSSIGRKPTETLVAGQPNLYSQPLSVDLSKPLAAELNAKRVITLTDSNGRLCIYALDRNNALKEVRATEDLIKTAYKNLADSYNEKIAEARRQNNQQEVERLLVKQQSILDESYRYKSDPAFASKVNGRFGKLADMIAKPSSKAVNILFLATLALMTMPESKARAYEEPSLKGN